MFQILIILFVLGILYWLFTVIVEKLTEASGFVVKNLGGGWRTLILVVASVIGFLAMSWRGILIVFVVYAAFIWLLKAGVFIGKSVNTKLDQDKKNYLQNNEDELRKELEVNCKRLGYMNREMWAQKLPNFAKKEYISSFDSIVSGFAVQVEESLITQNDEWFIPFRQYLIAHPQGATAVKMLEEVSCPQLNATHHTANIDLLTKRLEKGTKRVSKDVPPLFDKVDTHVGCLYTPTKYALKLYAEDAGKTNSSTANTEEINFDDL